MSRVENGYICTGCARSKLGQNTLGRVVTPAPCGICGQHGHCVRGVIPEGMHYRAPEPPPPVEAREFAEWAQKAGVMPDENVRAAFLAGYEVGERHGRARERSKLRDALEDSRDD